jgi:hypothetical protein
MLYIVYLLTVQSQLSLQSFIRIAKLRFLCYDVSIATTAASRAPQLLCTAESRAPQHSYYSCVSCATATTAAPPAPTPLLQRLF